MNLYDRLKRVDDDYRALRASELLQPVLTLSDEQWDKLTFKRNDLFLEAATAARREHAAVDDAYAQRTTISKLVGDFWQRLPYVIPKRTFWEWLMKGEQKARELSATDTDLVMLLSGPLDDFKARPKYELENHCIGPLRARASFVDMVLGIAREHEELKKSLEDVAKDPDDGAL